MKPVKLSKESIKFIKSLPPKQAKQLAVKIMQIRCDEAHDVKKLMGTKDFLRADAGEYRIVYRLDNNTVLVAIIGKRNDDEVYKRFKRKNK